MEPAKKKEITERVKANPNSKNCQGEGVCLEQTGIYPIYLRSKPCQYNCKPVKCPNFIVCGQVAPLQVMWCHGSRCNYCNQKYGKDLIFKRGKEECTICLEEKDLWIKMPNCDHYFCLLCFRRLHGYHLDSFWPFDSEGNVNFDEAKVIKDKAELPSLSKYDKDDGCDEEDEEIIFDPSYKKCPLCRRRTIPDWKQKMIDEGRITDPEDE
jgi:hypothetical protein